MKLPLPMQRPDCPWQDVHPPSVNAQLEQVPQEFALRNESQGRPRPVDASTMLSGSTVVADRSIPGMKAFKGKVYDRERWTFKPRGTSLPTSSNAPVASTSRQKLPEWQGMAMNSQEIWDSHHLGMYKVSRRALSSTLLAKPPHQRMDVQPYLDPCPTTDSSQSVIIHKHSKVSAFTILKNRAARPPSSSKRGKQISQCTTPPRSGGPMILLAPRKVQVAFTNTMTTQSLATHGLLDSPVHLPPPNPAPSPPHSPGTSSFPPPTFHYRIDLSELDNYNGPEQGTVKHRLSLDGIGFGPRQMNCHNDRVENDNDEEDNDDPDLNDLDDEFGRRRSQPKTPHSITYGIVSSDMLRHSTSYPSMSLSRSISGKESMSRFLRRLVSTSSGGNQSTSKHDLDIPAYWPPWIVTANRNTRVAKNSSESKERQTRRRRRTKDSANGVKTKKRSATGSGQGKSDLFAGIPDETLFMLLPLWIGESDPNMDPESTDCRRVKRMREDRRYLLAYYQPSFASSAPFSASGRERTTTEEGHRRRTTSGLSSRQPDRAAILLTSFSVIGRIVKHDELQGSGVRLPDEGLCPIGELVGGSGEERAPTVVVGGVATTSVVSLPADVANGNDDVDQGFTDWVIGECFARDSGIEFDPNGLARLGLCIQKEEEKGAISDQHNMREVDQVSKGPIASNEWELTQVGGAVTEMVWMGALALTSFGTVVG